MSIASGYSVNLNCDECLFEWAEFGGSESSREVWREVAKSGWKIDKKKRTAICPKCAAKVKAEGVEVKK